LHQRLQATLTNQFQGRLKSQVHRDRTIRLSMKLKICPDAPSSRVHNLTKPRKLPQFDLTAQDSLAIRKGIQIVLSVPSEQ
jgi:hypothetical protein